MQDSALPADVLLVLQAQQGLVRATPGLLLLLRLLLLLLLLLLLMLMLLLIDIPFPPSKNIIS
jgi:hypothetical protein